MVSNYLKLQYKLLTRHIKATGLPIAVVPCFLLGVCYLAYYLLQQYPIFGSYALLLINFQLLFLLTEKNRNDFLKNTYHRKDFYRIRLLENGILILPSALLLLAQQLWLHAIILIAMAPVFTLLTFQAFGRSLPTPFAKKPFEYITGFRRSYLLILLLYLLAAIGLFVANANLVLFCVAGIALTCACYYQFPEPVFYLWNSRYTAGRFLLRKYRRGVLQCLLLTLPVLIPYALVFPLAWFNALIVLVGIFFLLPFAITLKYVAYPREINFPEGFALILCFSFYPLIFALFPFYYTKALKNLKNYL